jgi:transcriptional regulator
MDGTGATPRPGVMNRFEPGSPADVAALTRGQMLGLVISGPLVTPLPLLTETDETGVVTGFFGHFGLTNPQVEALKADPRALIVFQGPHAYVPPAWVSDPTWAPTWNYALASFQVEIVFDASENERSIVELSRALEGDRWTPAQMGARFAPMLTRIIAFRAKVVGAEAKFKLGQDEKPTTFAEVVEALGDAPIVSLMKQQRGE